MKGIHPTPEMVEAAYEFLRTTPPFRRWRLPPGEELEFYVRHARHYVGLCHEAQGAMPARITVSSRWVGLPATLLLVVAHEMVHLYQARRGTSGPGEHNQEFHRLARRVCTVHGFDYRSF